MKTYKIYFWIGAPTCLKAEGYEENRTSYQFYRRNSIIAEFAKVSVLRIEELESIRPAPLVDLTWLSVPA